MASTREEVERFVGWQDWEGGLLDLALSHGTEVFPEELQTEAEALINSYETLRKAFGALLVTHDVTY